MIISRHGTDDYQALMIAQAKESVGGDVFSIVWNGTNNEYPYVIFAKCHSSVTPAMIDDAIGNFLYN